MVRKRSPTSSVPDCYIWICPSLSLKTANIRTLPLTERHNLHFFVALNPEKTPGGVILCPLSTELTLHVHLEARFCIGELCEIARARASRLAVLRVTVICIQQ